MTGIIGAMPVEVDRLIEAMENKTPETISRMTFWRGELNGAPLRRRVLRRGQG